MQPSEPVRPRPESPKTCPCCTAAPYAAAASPSPQGVLVKVGCLMAKPQEEGSGRTMRTRHSGHGIYQGGFEIKEDAAAAMHIPSAS